MKNRILKIVTSIILTLTVSLSSSATSLLFMPTVSVYGAEKKMTVDELIKSMTLRDKIAQMMMVSFRYWDEDLAEGENPTNFTGSIADLTAIIRIKLTGRKNTPDLYEIMKLLGENEVKSRLTK